MRKQTILFLILSTLLHAFPANPSAERINPFPASGTDFPYTIWDDWYEVPDTIFLTDTLRDTVYISSLEDITRHFGLTFDEYVDQFITFRQEKDTLHPLFPTDIYLNYFLPLIKNDTTFMKMRLIHREYTPYQNNQLLKLPRTYRSESVFFPAKGHPLDILLTFYGSENTNLFLQSGYAQQSCLEQLFALIYYSPTPIQGINLHFPDYSFENKRKMAQFVKSVSLVTDSSRLENKIRDLKLYVTFNQQHTGKEYNYLCCLTQMADSVFIADSPEKITTYANFTTIDHRNAKKIPVLQKIRNQFYLARYTPGVFPETDPETFRLSDIRLLMHSDYHDNKWENYLYGLIGIFLTIILIFILYFTSSTVADIINNNRDYVYTLLVMVILEIYLLTFTMIENMSRDNIFTFSNDNEQILLLLPLLFLFILPMMRSIRNRKNLP